MNTEMTKYNGEVLHLGWIFFDAECGVCAAGRRRLGRIFERRGFRWLPLQTPGTAARLGVSEAELRSEMRLQLADGRVLAGIDAWIHLWRSVWWLWPLALLASVPGLHGAGDTLYRWVARHRYCFAGRCAVRKGTIL